MRYDLSLLNLPEISRHGKKDTTRKFLSGDIAKRERAYLEYLLARPIYAIETWREENFEEFSELLLCRAVAMWEKNRSARVAF